MDDGFKKPEELVPKEQDDRDVERAVKADEKNQGVVASTPALPENLPFSKARCIAIVATVACAPFLSVRNSAAKFSQFEANHCRHSTCRQRSLRSRQ